MYYEAVAVDGSKINRKFCYFEWVDVLDFQIVNVPGYCHLLSVDRSVGNAWVLWVDCEWRFVIFEVLDKLSVEKEGALEKTVYCL
jgi:hypothetical protein